MTENTYDTRKDFQDDYDYVRGTGINEDGDIIAFVTSLDKSDDFPNIISVDGSLKFVYAKEIGIPHILKANEGDILDVDRHRSHHRPSPGGVSIGNKNVTAGTQGSCLLKTEDDVGVVLTNAHVSSGATDQFQPSEMDSDLSRYERYLGQLLEESYLDPEGENTTDSALISVHGNAAKQEILGLGDLEHIGNPVERSTYYKSSRNGIHTGELVARDVEMDIAFGEDNLRFVGLDAFTNMSDPGCSGSLIIREDSNQELVATNLLFAGSPTITLAIPMKTVQEEHGKLEIVKKEDEDDDDDDYELPEPSFWERVIVRILKFINWLLSRFRELIR